MRGVTLVELLVVLSVLGLILGVTGLALGSLTAPRESVLASDLRKARAEAIQSGERRKSHGVLFLPDGRAVGASVDPMTGIPRAQ